MVDELESPKINTDKTVLTKLNLKKSSKNLKLQVEQKSQVMKDYEKAERKAAEKLETLQQLLENPELREAEKLKIDLVINT